MGKALNSDLYVWYVGGVLVYYLKRPWQVVSPAHHHSIQNMTVRHAVNCAEGSHVGMENNKMYIYARPKMRDKIGTET